MGKSKKINKVRLAVVVLLLSMSYGYTITRLFSLQLVSADILQKYAENQYIMRFEMAPRRGLVCDVRGRELAVSMKVPSVFANPYEIENPVEVSARLNRILNINQDKILKRLNRKKYFVWIKRKISNEEFQMIEAAEIPGIHFIKESKRFYPQGELASHVLGFVNIDNVGQEGIERTFENYLLGEAGYRKTQKDAKKRELFSFSDINTSVRDGDTVYLTIDTTIQYIAEREVDKVFKKYHPESVSIVVMDPHTGAILALANRPTFDPNQYGKVDGDKRRNRVITDIYEPGSTFKVIAASAALEEKLFLRDEKIYCENGEYKMSGRRMPLHDYHSYGWLSFDDVIKKSSNIGTVKIAQRLGSEKLHEYIRRFGFGARTNINLPGEQFGIFHPLNKWTRSSMSAVPIGQEIAVTSLQMVRAFSVFANGGWLVEPQICSRIENVEGVVIKTMDMNKRERILSSETCRDMREILQKVVSRDGTAYRAALDNFSAAGKTGTAQKADLVRGGYAENKYVASFIGFAPADDPSITILVTVDEPPWRVRFGGTIAAPVFKNVAEDVLRYMESNGRMYGKNHRKDNQGNQS